MVRASRRTLASRPLTRPANRWLLSGCFLLVLGLLMLWWPVSAAIFVFCAAIGSALTWREKRRLAVMAAQRVGESICTFVRGFDYRRTDTLVIRAVYDLLQPQSAFPLHADDQLETDLHIDGEDLDMDFAPSLASRTGRSLDNAKENPYFGKVKTVADLVGFFCLQPVQPTKPV